MKLKKSQGLIPSSLGKCAFHTDFYFRFHKRIYLMNELTLFDCLGSTRTCNSDAVKRCKLWLATINPYFGHFYRPVWCGTYH